MTYNEDDIKQNIIELIQERDKYRLQAFKYREALEEILGCEDEYVNSIIYKALKEGDDA